jgi:hypothetical protein
MNQDDLEGALRVPERLIPVPRHLSAEAQAMLAAPWPEDLSAYPALDDSVAVPMTVPSRMLVYFAACENPIEYTGRLFWAERELAELGIELN